MSCFEQVRILLIYKHFPLAIEQELLQQKRTLSKQREDYVRRKFSLSRELSRLKDQKRDLMKENSKENERILRENAKLQVGYELITALLLSL